MDYNRCVFDWVKERGTPAASARVKRSPAFDVPHDHGAPLPRDSPPLAGAEDLLSQEHSSEEEADADTDIIKEEEEQKEEVESGPDDESLSGRESPPCAAEPDASGRHGDPTVTPELASGAEETDPEVEVADPCPDPPGGVEEHAAGGDPGEADRPGETDTGGLTDEDSVAPGEEAGQTLVEKEPEEEPERSSSTAQADAGPRDAPNSGTLADTATAGRSRGRPGSDGLSHTGVRKRESHSERRRLKVLSGPASVSLWRW